MIVVILIVLITIVISLPARFGSNGGPPRSFTLRAGESKAVIGNIISIVESVAQSVT